MVNNDLSSSVSGSDTAFITTSASSSHMVQIFRVILPIYFVFSHLLVVLK